VVTLAYSLLDAEGDVVEQGGADEPLQVLFGYGEAGPALEHALDGAAEGQDRVVRLKPEEAFGERDPGAIISVSPSELPPGVGPGDEFDAEGEGGETVVLKVVEVTDGEVLLDTNHPLSGQRITLRVHVLSVREARPEEIDAAVERLTRAPVAPGPLLPAEQLLRRKRVAPP
jgi:FKBP-type peptidyl-prolyl cis-trans isomerase SlyD